MSQNVSRLLLLTAHLLVVPACSKILDAGSDLPDERLPVGPKNPVILTNDGAYDNWQGEYAVLLAHTGGPPLAGIVVNAAGMWFDLDANISGWQELVERARASGLSNVPDPIRSTGPSLRRPEDGRIESTVPNSSEGARFIVETSARLSRPDLPVVVATGGRLTDVADAFLIDPSVTERIVVISALGSGLAGDDPRARMGVPNGELDAWSSAIVVQRFRYIQVSAFYDQLTDVTSDRLGDLPDNPFGAWIREKQPSLLSTRRAADQVAVLALGIPAFVRGAIRVSFSGFDGSIPLLAADADGSAFLVEESDGAAATARLWQILKDPATFMR